MTTLDKIVRSVLLQKGLPLHYYMQFLKLSADCIRELSFDSARIVNTVELVVNQQDFSVPTPCDYVDWTKIGIPIGQKIRPIYEVDSINRLQAKNPDGQTTTFTSAQDNSQNNLLPGWPGYWLFQNIDDLGENTGRQFGISAANTTNGFKVILEGNRIQLTESFTEPTIILEYISDCQSVDNASMVDPYAQAVIEAYDDWKFKLHIRRSGLGEVATAFDLFKRELRRYRARKSDLTLLAIKQAIYSNYKQSPKT